jgi:cellulose synthase/poly-beta-1,6-N-acetylglucosamine synthase-like glycosyltransferase
MDYPSEQFAVTVLADRCTDATAEVARMAGADVIERTGGEDGKGALLAWYLAQEPLRRDEDLVVFDADNRVGSDLLMAYSDALDSGYDVAQSYLDVSNPDESWLATASALSYWASNRMVQLARHNLGWGPDLGGTGTAYTGAVISEIGGFPGSQAEDQEQAARLMVTRHRVAWLHENRIYDQKPTGLRAAVGQRARWQAGKRSVARAYARRLLEAALRQLRWGPIDMLVRLWQPGRSFMVLVAALLGVLSFFVPMLWPWWLWATLVAVQVLAPIPFLARDHVGWRYLLRYPLLAVFGLLWLPIRLVSYRLRGWYHTPHE